MLHLERFQCSSLCQVYVCPSLSTGPWIRGVCPCETEGSLKNPQYTHTHTHTHVRAHTIELTKKFIRVSHTSVQKNSNKLFGHPNTLACELSPQPEAGQVLVKNTASSPRARWERLCRAPTWQFSKCFHLSPLVILHQGHEAGRQEGVPTSISQARDCPSLSGCLLLQLRLGQGWAQVGGGGEIFSHHLLRTRSVFALYPDPSFPPPPPQ